MADKNTEDLSKRLEIFLVTFNRIKNLRFTLEQIFSDKSPIKNFKITVLNNNSTDGSTELLDEYAKAHPNMTHIKHNRNIGGNPNIARCFELASYEYFWILCDDDVYHWENWHELKEGIDKKADCIFVCNSENPETNLSQVLCQATFVPSGIYKSSILNDTVMSNIYFNTSFYFPHMAVICEILNKNGLIHICKNSIVRKGQHEQKQADDSSFTRGYDDSLSPIQAHSIWITGFIQATTILKDEKLKKKIFDDLTFYDVGVKMLRPRPFIRVNFDPNEGDNDKRNKLLYYYYLPSKYRLQYHMENFSLYAELFHKKAIKITRSVLKKTPVYPVYKLLKKIFRLSK